MLPDTGTISDIILAYEKQSSKTKTFNLNAQENIVSGLTDGLNALKQSIYLILNIESDQYIIYPYTYGFKTVDLIGKPSYYVSAVIPDRIKETLMTDNRITDVSDFEFETEGNKLHISFVVHTIYGENLNTETVVTY